MPPSGLSPLAVPPLRDSGMCFAQGEGGSRAARPVMHSNLNRRRRHMFSTTRRLVQVALVATMLPGCMTTGTIDGRVAVPDKPAAAIAFTYTASWGRHGGTLSTTLPSGENFSGQYVHITST